MKYVIDALFYLAILLVLYFAPPTLYNAMQIAFFGE